MDVEYVHSEFLPLWRQYAEDSLSGLRLYLQTLEDFINEAEKEEIEEITARFPGGTKIDWSWHYPVHWEEIFFTQLRSSFIVSIISVAEVHLGMICKQVFYSLSIPFEYNDKENFKVRGNNLIRGKKYLRKFGDFKNPNDKLWDLINLIYLVRCCIVHNDNDIEGNPSKKQRDKLCNFVDKQPGLSESQKYLKIHSEFPIFSIDKIQEFVFSLYDELEQLCARKLKAI